MGVSSVSDNTIGSLIFTSPRTPTTQLGLLSNIAYAFIPLRSSTGISPAEWAPARYKISARPA